MDSFIKCDYCKKNLTSPLELVCRHTYCSDCLTKEIQNDNSKDPPEFWLFFNCYTKAGI